CCSDPELLVTLTHRDIYNLFKLIEGDFDALVSTIDFIEASDLEVRRKLVYPHFETSLGSAVLALKKGSNGECVYYNLWKKLCRIYFHRPNTCKSFPFSFLREGDQIAITVTVKGKKYCNGLGKGNNVDYRELERLGHEILNEIEETKFIAEQVNGEAMRGNPLTPREVIAILLTYAADKQTK
ncbi:MAG: YkgJ family cysteine cluster protein, partial [Candidatus Odinarchaeota archaeon]